MYKLEYSKDSKKFLEKHKNDTISHKILDSLFLLSQNPRNNSLDTKKMKGTKEQYRLRVGDYRIIYKIFEEKLIVYAVDIGPRGDIYK